jgi:hypothetical protein
MAGQQLVEHRAQAPHVGALVHLVDMTEGLLRAHVPGRAQGRTVDGGVARAGGDPLGGIVGPRCPALDLGAANVVGALDLGQPPVEHHGLAELADHDVAWLDIPVDHPAVVGVGHGLAHVPELAEQLLAIGQGSAVLELLSQGLAAHELHRVVEPTVVATADLVDRYDVGMLELGRDPRLPQEPPGESLGRGRSHAAVREPLGQQLLPGDGASGVTVVSHQHAGLSPPPVFALDHVAVGRLVGDLGFRAAGRTHRGAGRHGGRLGDVRMSRDRRIQRLGRLGHSGRCNERLAAFGIVCVVAQAGVPSACVY